VLGTLVLLMWAVYGFLFYWIGTQKGVYLINALVASFVILILFEPVRNRLENGVNRWLLRQRTGLRARIEAVRRGLAGVVDVGDMVQRILTALEESRQVTDGSIYLLDADGTGFDRAGHFGQLPPERIDANAERGLLDRVRGGHLDKEAIARELAELGVGVAPENESRHAALLALKTRIDELHAGMIFPIYGSALPDLRLGRDRAGTVAARPVLRARRPHRLPVRLRRRRRVPPAHDLRRPRDRGQPGVRAREGA
jgi:hypothetical protein